MKSFTLMQVLKSELLKDFAIINLLLNIKI